MPTLRFLALPVFLALSACSTPMGGSDGGADASSAETGDGSGGSSSLVGVFQVQVVPPEGMTAGYTQVLGRVQTGETPSQVVWELAQSDGDCRLLTPRVPFCNPGCGATGACVENNTCRAFPSAVSAGTVRITGLRATGGTAAPIDLLAVSNAYQLPGGTMLAYPAFSEGDMLRIEASGNGMVPAFSLDARGIAPLVLADGTLALATGQPLTLRWTGSMQAMQRIGVKLDISHHGGSRGMVTCDTADDGELAISAPLITRLVALGVAGFPTVIVTRSYTTTMMQGSGKFSLAVSAAVERAVEIPGVRSCTSDTECGAGSMCRADLTCS